MKTSIFALLCSVFALASSPAFAIQKCATYNSEVTLSGVITTSATYVDPRDFGWAPENGFVSYAVLVTNTPVCFSDAGEYVDNVRVLQIFGVDLPSAEALKGGVAVKVKGTVFPPETAHHFGKLMLNASSVTIKK